MEAPAPAPSAYPVVDSAEPAKAAPAHMHEEATKSEAKPCADTAPTGDFTCEQQAEWNKCGYVLHQRNLQIGMCRGRKGKIICRKKKKGKEF